MENSLITSTIVITSKLSFNVAGSVRHNRFFFRMMLFHNLVCCRSNYCLLFCLRRTQNLNIFFIFLFIDHSTSPRDIAMENSLITSRADIASKLSLIVAGSVRHRAFKFLGFPHNFIFLHFLDFSSIDCMQVGILIFSIIFTSILHFSILTFRIIFIMENTPTTSTVVSLSYLGSCDAPSVRHNLVFVDQFV